MKYWSLLLVSWSFFSEIQISDDEEENKLSEMLKEVGLELEDFSSENSFNQGFNNEERRKTIRRSEEIESLQSKFSEYQLLLEP